ncbi:excinuclease ATPase subunit [Cupriavidus basilensis]|uniref:excinuclease ATPase subunit n=1 Tax=Cupriavidus basilensis TaxID=68895 RepID=UPI0023E8BB7C|nr:excinuclease ATPase subunit [Cupriavidus basilensis]MDF3888441.1 excinuclease ATPase subunit [Cupriavidus basilensis]
MKHALPLVAVAICANALLSAPAIARDTKYMLPFKDVLVMPEAQEKLDGSVKFFLSGQQKPKVIETRESDVSNRKTSSVGKSDEDACRWAALSALLAFQEKARSVGVNAVVDIVSYYKKNEVANATEYECHAGAVVAGVALKGTYAKVAN